MAAAAEVIENNIRKEIVEKCLINPKYFEKMSAILEELIKARHDGAVAYEKLLERYVKIVKDVKTPENNPHYPECVRKSGALRAFYDNCGGDAELAIALDEAVRGSIIADFRHNEFKERKIKRALFEVLNDKNEVERVYNIVVEQGEY